MYPRLRWIISCFAVLSVGLAGFNISTVQAQVEFTETHTATLTQTTVAETPTPMQFLDMPTSTPVSSNTSATSESPVSAPSELLNLTSPTASSNMESSMLLASQVLSTGTYNEDHAGIAYTPGWLVKLNSLASNGTQIRTAFYGETASFTFSGTQLIVLYTKTSDSGVFKITIDGINYKFNAYSANKQYDVRWASPPLTAGSHTVVIQKRDNDEKRIYLDGLTVVNSIPTSTKAAIVVPLASPTRTPTRTIPTPTIITSGTVYYVSASGSDSNAGTSAKPWKTIQKAASMVNAGSTVIVQAGTYNERVQLSRSGTNTAPITFEAQGKVVMQGFTVQADYIKIRGFEITDTPDHSTSGWGIWVQGSNCLIENNYIHFAKRGGIRLYAEAGAQTLTANCVVRNNRLYRNTKVGVEVNGRNHLVEKNEVWGTIQYHPLASAQSSPDADGIRFFGSGHVFRGNYIHDILYGIPENIDPHIDCFQTWAGGSASEAASNVIFEQNRCENAQVQAKGEVGHGFMLYASSNITIRNNIIAAYKGVLAPESNSNLIIVNNTFTNDLTLPLLYPIGLDLNAPNITIRNNIFYNFPREIIYLYNSTGLNAGNNLAYRSDGIRPLSNTSYAHTNDLWGVNPLFKSATDYHLSPGSPAIDAGSTVSVKNDYDGAPRPQGKSFDIGAFEANP